MNLKLDKKYSRVYTFDEYIKIPIADREKWGLYLIPHSFALEENTLNKFEEYWKEYYPIQFFVRKTVGEFLSVVCWKLEELYWNINDFFFPKQRWLTKQIPRHWCDKAALIPNLLFACFIHFVEEERGLESRSWYIEEGDQKYDYRHIEKDLRMTYRYAKHIRDRLEKSCYRSSNYYLCRLMENIYKKCEQHYLMIIIKHLEYLWV